MEEKSKQWRSLKLATIERANLKIKKPVTPFLNIYFGSCVCFLFNYIRFINISPPEIHNPATYVQIIAIATSAIFIFTFTSFILLYCFINITLEKLANE